ncbi:carbohydrate-binding module family 43 protein/Glycoside hydrolase family 72 protein [Amylostereum chailletii]|nr:carbohydrate-binding module family 43 protein/Glycoside hydrolase family 72 protein [Amylostereum chailletii]
MISLPRFTACLAVAAGLSSTVNAIGKVTRTGRYLYNADGSRFYVKGVAYQPQGVTDANNPFQEPTDFIDPLADAAGCSRDLPFLQQLGVNAVRVYSVNSSLNHDSCMQAFSGAGIYTIIDLSLPVNGSIDRSSAAWTTALQDQYTASIDAFSKYDNVLAYNVGNEVVISPDGTGALAFVKAAARDTKAYLKSKSSSALVGYAAVDGDDWIVPVANYLSCDPSNGNSDSTAIDLYGLNNYELCGNQTFQQAYATKTALFAGYNVAAYFSEFGCNNPSPRVWADVPALFSDAAVPVWSGGVAFSYFPAQSGQGQFGMVTISSDNTTVQTSQDFDNLKAQYTSVSLINNPPAGNSATAYPSCPTQNATFLASTTLPPTPVDSACACVESSLSCQFTPQVSNTTAIVGTLLDTACQLLGQQGSNCNSIAGNGTTGTYGAVAACDPSVKLSFVMSQFYELNNRNPESCSFAGNGTVNANAPASVTAASAAASSCLSSATGVSTPSPASGSSSSSGSGSSTSKTPNAASRVLSEDGTGLMGVALMLVISVASGIWSLI